MEIEAYADLSVGNEFEEEAGDGGAEQLGDPVEDPGEDGDVAADGQAEGHGGVEVPAGDVGGNRNTNKEGEGVGDRHRHEASRVQGAIVGQFPYTKSSRLLALTSTELHTPYT